MDSSTLKLLKQRDFRNSESLRQPSQMRILRSETGRENVRENAKKTEEKTEEKTDEIADAATGERIS